MFLYIGNKTVTSFFFLKKKIFLLKQKMFLYIRDRIEVFVFAEKWYTLFFLLKQKMLLYIRNKTGTSFCFHFKYLPIAMYYIFLLKNKRFSCMSGIRGQAVKKITTVRYIAVRETLSVSWQNGSPIEVPLNLLEHHNAMDNVGMISIILLAWSWTVEAYRRVWSWFFKWLKKRPLKIFGFQKIIWTF